MKTQTVLWLLVLGAANAWAAEDFVDPQLNLRFPPSISKLPYVGQQKYDAPGMGYSLRYATPQVKADIYLYDSGLSDIGDGIASKQVQSQFDQVLSAFPIMVKQGYYRDVKPLSRGKKTFGKTKRPFLWARYEYEVTAKPDNVSPGARISDTYLTGFQGQFVKLRITGEKMDEEKWDKISTDFAKSLSRVLDRKPDAAAGPKAKKPANQP